LANLIWGKPRHYWREGSVAGPSSFLARRVAVEMCSVFIGNTVPGGRVRRRNPFVRDIWPFFCIFGVECEPLLQAGFGVGPDRFDGTFGHADTAVDAFIRMDHEHILALVEAVHRAYLYAVHVFALYAGLGNYKSHLTPCEHAGDSRNLPALETNGAPRRCGVGNKIVVCPFPLVGPKKRRGDWGRIPDLFAVPKFRVIPSLI
jgi:hypothetical protein